MAVDAKGSGKMENLVNSWVRGSLIGQGAFGTVNLALNRESGELFAVKSIEWNANNNCMSGEMRAMENEVRILESLKNSPFVVNCLGSSISVEDGKTMRNMFMEYMPGGSVADLMKKFGGFGFEEPLIRKYTTRILEGIQYLHEEGIVHCDIKGRNLLVGSTGVVKLADFGGARRLGLEGEGEGEDAAVLTVDSDLLLNVKGTPLWMAPEVVRQVEQGPASDIWSLGCTVVEMATGKAPWSDIVGTDPWRALYHIGCTEEVPDLPACLSEQGRDFLSKCFQRDPRVRWTATQLLQHPFITDTFTIQSHEPTGIKLLNCASPTSAVVFLPAKPADALPTSPTSAFDFPSSSSTASTTIVNSVPILRSPLHFFPRRFPEQQQQQQSSNFFQTEDPSTPSVPSTPSTPSTPSAWANSPLSDFGGQWITVRTPTKTVSPAPSLPSPTFSSALTRVEEAESVSLKVEEESTAPVASLGGLTVDEAAEEPQEHEESREMSTTSRASSSSSAVEVSSSSSSSSRGSEQNVVEDDRINSSSSHTDGENSEQSECSCSTAPGEAAGDDQRCIDPRGIPKAICGSSRATLRILQNRSARRKKLSYTGRRRRGGPKPRLNRSRVRRGSYYLLHGQRPACSRRDCNDRYLESPPLRNAGWRPSPFIRNRKLATSVGRFHSSFRETLRSRRRVYNGSLVGRALLRAKLRSLFFRNRYGWKLQPLLKCSRLFLNKGASPQWLLLKIRKTVRACE